MHSTRITELANLIASKTAIVNEYFEFHGIPSPTFDINGTTKILIPVQLKEIVKAHNDVLEATRELHALMQGPRAMIMETTVCRIIHKIPSVINEILSEGWHRQPNDLLSLQVIYHYQIAPCVPIDAEISYDDLSEKCGLNVTDLRRILRYAMLNHIFRERRKGFVAHTAASRLLAEDKALSAWVGLRTEEHFQAAARVESCHICLLSSLKERLTTK